MPESAQAPQAQLPLRRAETAAGFVLVVQVVATAVALGLALGFKSQAALAEAWHLAVGVAVWVVALVHQRLRRLAAEESQEVESLLARRERETSSSLFEEEQQLDLQIHRNRLAGFEKYFLPGFAGVLVLTLGGLAYALISRVATTAKPAPVGEPLMTAMVFAVIAFVSFLLGRYTGGLATHKAWRAVRAGASWSLSNAVGSFLVMVALLAYHAEVEWVERVVGYVIPGVLGLMAVEVLLNQVLAIYRPRVAGQEYRPAYDSRLLGMLTEARGLIRTTADTLDYQFGFKVSETWFFRFMERAIAPLILFQLVTFYLLTCFTIVRSGEEAVIERWGKPLRGRETLKPGLHVKWPWPIDQVRRYPVERVEMLMVGEQIKEEADAYLWTVSHAEEPFYLLVANKATVESEDEEGAPPPEGETERGEKRVRSVPVSMLSGTIHVYYRVSDLYAYLYNYRNPEAMLDALCYRELTRYTVAADFMHLLGAGRGAAAETLAKNIRDRATAEKLGVEVVGVSLQGVHPPVEVGPAFEDVVGAVEEAHASVEQGKAYRLQKVPEARAEALGIEREAEAYQERLEAISQADAFRFQKRLGVYRIATYAYVHRELLDALVETLAGRRKIVKPEWADTDEVIQFDLQKAIRGMELESLLGAPTGGGTP
ncbi:MAG: protease modulator HflK [Planctomycetota bacterium]